MLSVPRNRPNFPLLPPAGRAFCVVASLVAASSWAAADTGSIPRVEFGDPVSAEKRQAQLRDWVREQGESLPVVRPDGKRSRESAGKALGSKQLYRLVMRAANFARDFNVESDPSVRSDFRAQLQRAIGPGFPGFAWVVVAARSSWNLDLISGRREGGGAGIQLPVLGERGLWLSDHSGQVVLRLLPLAGNIESVTIGNTLNSREDLPGSGLVLRPSAELEARLREGIAHAGARVLAQPRIDEPSDYRLLAEVYVEVQLNRGNLVSGRTSIVPRCVLDLRRGNSRYDEAENELERRGFLLADNVTTCTVNTEISFGR